MDHLIGQRFNLISKSEIRYLGTLHEINPEQSTIALEDVFSFGTEDRQVDSFIPPSQQKFDYIVFRGSDVKDIKIAEEQNEPKQPSPPSMPNDPAILVSSHILYTSSTAHFYDEIFRMLITDLFRMRKMHVDIFRCLPSDRACNHFCFSTPCDGQY